MKVFSNIIKVLTALAAVAGVVYVVATYGDKIVAWAKKLLNCGSCKSEPVDCADCEAECPCEPEEAPAEEAAPAEETVEEAPAAEEAPAVEEIVIEEHEPVAEESDFEA